MSVKSSDENQTTEQEHVREFEKHPVDTRGAPQSITFNTIEDKMINGTSEKERFLARIVRRLSLTSGARFETARRHKKKHRVSTISIIVLTMYAIFFAMISSLLTHETASRELLSMVSVFMSSFVAAFTLFEYSKRYDARSEAFLRCAIKMQCLRDQATLKLYSGEFDWSHIKDVEDGYGELLNKYTDNHGVVDYLSHRASIGKLDKRRRRNLRIMHFFNVWMLFIISILSPWLILLLYKTILMFFTVSAGNATSAGV